MIVARMVRLLKERPTAFGFCLPRSRFSRQFQLEKRLETVQKAEQKYERSASLIRGLGISFGLVIALYLGLINFIDFKQTVRFSLRLLQLLATDRQHLQNYIVNLKMSFDKYSKECSFFFSQIQFCAANAQICVEFPEMLQIINIFQAANPDCYLAPKYRLACEKLLAQATLKNMKDWGFVAEALLRHGNVRQMYVGAIYLWKHGLQGQWRENQEKWRKNLEKEIEADKKYYQLVEETSRLKDGVPPHLAFKKVLEAGWVAHLTAFIA